jgi:hypothetical protein
LPTYSDPARSRIDHLPFILHHSLFSVSFAPSIQEDMEQPRPSPARPEATVMVVWPTIAATAAGRLVGRWSAIQTGPGGFFTLGKLLALATIPVSLAVFGWQLMPYVCRRYLLTNRRIIIQAGLSAVEDASIRLDGYDSIDVEILPGQEWHHAGDLVFRRGGTELFRLSGVSRPETFREVCLKTRTAMLTVRNVLQQQAGAAHA